jgi:hypothetical protein
MPKYALRIPPLIWGYSMPRFNKRWLILVAVLLGGVLFVLNNPASSCRVASSDVGYTFGKPFKLLTERDWIVGVSVNVTNRGGCEIHVKSATLTVLDVTYNNGTQTLNLEIPQSFNQAISAGNSTNIMIIIEPPFPLDPKALTVRFETTIAELDTPLSLEGQIELPESS